jgi:lipoprotein-anchoring transpeptidase ErfK/SrfK
MTKPFDRRAMLAGAAAFGLSATTLRAQESATAEAPARVQRNLAGFRSHDWRDHFDSRDTDLLVADTATRTLHYWHRDGRPVQVFPTSVPISPDLTRLGYTEIVRKVEGPSWRPTPSMRERNPEWPVVVPPGPDNPMGSHALHLSWQYYRIHGTHDVRKIGRPSSDGCIGLFNEQVAVLYDQVVVGAWVRLI